MERITRNAETRQFGFDDFSHLFRRSHISVLKGRLGREQRRGSRILTGFLFCIAALSLSERVARTAEVAICGVQLPLQLLNLFLELRYLLLSLLRAVATATEAECCGASDKQCRLSQKGVMVTEQPASLFHGAAVSLRNATGSSSSLCLSVGYSAQRQYSVVLRSKEDSVRSNKDPVRARRGGMLRVRKK